MPNYRENALIARANALRLPLRDESVDLIVTSPPYFGQRAYKDDGDTYDGQIGAEPSPQEFLAALWEVSKECWRVLKPRGVMFVNLGDKRSGSGAPGTTSGLSGRRATGTSVGYPSVKTQGQRSGMITRGSPRDKAPRGSGHQGAQYGKEAFGRAKSRQLIPHRFAIGCEDGLADPDGIGWIVRQDMVWDKPNGMPESVTDRTRDNHEYWFMLCKQGDYFSAIDQIREPHLHPTNGATFGGSKSIGSDETDARYGNNTYDEQNPLGKLPSSVWRIATEPLMVPDYLGLEHFAAFPIEWPRRLVLAFAPLEGVVLDPFGGTGTTAMVARALGRRGYSFDLSADYCKLGRWRVFESGHNARVESRTNADRQGVLL